MSGGVDSSVAALLLCRQGYEATGTTCKLFGNDDLEGSAWGWTILSSTTRDFSDAR